MIDPNQMPWCKSYGPILRHWSSPWFVQMVIESLLFKRAMIGAVAVQECRELTQNSQPVRNKNRENTRQRKTITRTRQYLYGSAFYLHSWSCKDFTIIKEKYKCGNIVFQSLKNNNNNKTLITKTRFLNPAHKPKPPLYGLSLRKSPIENHAILFKSGQIVNQITHN